MPPQLPWRLIKSLQNKKIRRKTGKTVAEGPSPVLTAIKEGIKIDFLVMSEEFRDSPDGRAILEAWAENPSPAHTYVVTSHMFNRISHTLSPQGVLCVITLPFEYLDQRETGPWEEDLYIMGVDMQDPGNVGNLIRVGAACGAKILFSSASADPFSPKCIRSSAGSVFRANVGIINSPAEHLRRLKDEGVTLYKTVPAGGIEPWNVTFTGPLAVVLGNEARGLPGEILDLDGQNLSIPMPGGIESLNVFAASSMILYEIVRQRLLPQNF